MNKRLKAVILYAPPIAIIAGCAFVMYLCIDSISILKESRSSLKETGAIIKNLNGELDGTFDDIHESFDDIHESTDDLHRTLDNMHGNIEDLSKAYKERDEKGDIMFEKLMNKYSQADSGSGK